MKKNKSQLRNFQNYNESNIMDFERFEIDNPICSVQITEKMPLIKTFVKYCCSNLLVDEPVKITLTEEKIDKSFAMYDTMDNSLKVFIKNRHIVDVFRSIAHELKHHEQNINGRIEIGSGEDGSTEENEANCFAGLMLRKFGKLHPEIYEF